MSSSSSDSRPDRGEAIALVAAMVAVMWVSETVDLALGGALDGYGIEPRDGDGLAGVVLAPFLHSGFGHLVANTVPFLLMGAAIALGGAIRVVLVTAIVAAVSGLGTWLIAPGSSLHLGASGVVFGYATYLISRGLFSRDLLHLAVGGIVGILFGASLLGGLVPQEGISWQAHLFGAIGGVLAASLVSRGRDAGAGRSGHGESAIRLPA